MINPERWYTITQLTELAKQGVVPMHSRDSWLTLVKNEELPHLRKGDMKKFTYMIQGKDIIAYLDGNKIRKDKE